MDAADGEESTKAGLPLCLLRRSHLNLVRLSGVCGGGEVDAGFEGPPPCSLMKRREGEGGQGAAVGEEACVSKLLESDQGLEVTELSRVVCGGARKWRGLCSFFLGWGRSNSEASFDTKMEFQGKSRGGKGGGG